MPVMRVLVVGSGGREHALAWRLRQDPDVDDLLAAPGNPGIAAIARTMPVAVDDPDALLALAAREAVDLTVIGPEAPLAAGVADRFRAAGRALLGPGRYAAGLECSKAFAKRFMTAHDIPTARFVVCDALDAALDAVAGDRFGFPVVVKADGLAAGKGVVIAADRAEAEAAVRASMTERRFGAAGSRVVIEECLSGPEVSFFALCDGTSALELGTAQDHKRAYDDDRGPNTGGMGAFAPSPLVSDDLATRVMRDIVGRVMTGMRQEGDPYVGFLYVSLMLTADGPKVIEFNVRFGDPEAQVVVTTLHGSIAKAFHAAATGALGAHVVAHGAIGSSGRAAVGVVLASGGYPGAFAVGQPITGLERAEAEPATLVFHAGTRRDGDRLVTAGGRVLTVVSAGATFDEAIDRAYAGVRLIHFEGKQYRRDIGARVRGVAIAP
jgi:phosphoribosylamine--glycine ligase